MKFLKAHKPEILIAFLGVATYIISLANTFHTDDWVVLSLLRDGFSWQDFLSMENMARFRPLTNIFVYLRFLAFGDSPFGYYVLNIALHAFFAVLLYRFLIKIGLKSTISLMSALIFAAYFQHYEAVIWLYGTIRILGAIFWVASLWKLYDYLTSDTRSALVAFAIYSFLGYFIVEDLTASPLGFLAFSLLIRGNDEADILSYTKVSNISWQRIWQPMIVSLIGLVVYFIMRTSLIARPGIVENHYYFGPHIFSRLAAYFSWMILPPPDHPYFQGFMALLSPLLVMIWSVLSLASIAGLALASIYALVKYPRAIKFAVIFMLLALLPALPLDYKVTSRNIYIPSIGLSVLLGFLSYSIYERIKGRGWIRRLAIACFSAYIIFNIMAVWIVAREYRKNQTLVASLIDDMKNSGADLNRYKFVLLDHLPGRTVLGPAMIYKLNFTNEVIASNDPSAPGPNDIHMAARDIASQNLPFIVFDFREGHLIEATADYIYKGP